ncbi:alpha/beta hydrolase-fold protein [Algibacter sp. L4_22]|uniref:alpha/beta hydrolase-fold protein n=1 Tax=Algibacter sp. L4_22 TaxID=2942477 RepID=UPI00201B827C|nr:alpha/beta hydrolase-fold protein [Algibacter sp. L4_22]MCL5130202.1 esterase family protein [Algibacter sp. L4_22]
MKKTYLLIVLFLIFGFHSNAQIFEVSFASSLIKEDFSGNVLLYLSKDNKSPKDIFVGLELTPVYRVVVNNLKANEIAVFKDDAVSYPVELSNIERGEYYVQAVFDLNLGDVNIGSSSGNIYSDPIRINLTKDFNKVFKIKADKVIKPIKFNETEFLKEVSVKSNLLSKFHKKDMFINAAVSLPKEYYNQPNKEYPVIFSIFGFGANYKLHSGRSAFLEQLEEESTIVVYLDGNCSEGHSTYANSDVNGPWGDALVKELIPVLKQKYRTNGAFLLHGHSSGGWTTLWLQINYPKTFAGAWSSAPDQVDFRNYQNVNIYEADNIFYKDKGNMLPLFTIAGRIPVINAKDFYKTENVIYRGSQIHSFDAVFGGYDKDGNRIRLVDIATGEINKDALALWKRYDISILLRENWANLKDDLQGKIRISVGNSDNIFLNRSVQLLEKEMKPLNTNIVFSYVPGDHFTIFTDEYKKDGMQFLIKCYKNWLIKNK